MFSPMDFNILTQRKALRKMIKDEAEVFSRVSLKHSLSYAAPNCIPVNQNGVGNTFDGDLFGVLCSHGEELHKTHSSSRCLKHFRYESHFIHELEMRDFGHLQWQRGVLESLSLLFPSCMFPAVIVNKNINMP